MRQAALSALGALVLLLSLAVQTAVAAQHRALSLIWPAKGRITDPFGYPHGRHHPGIDIGMLRSLAVRSAVGGKVVATGYAPGYEGYGKIVAMRARGFLVVYGHLSRVRVHKGQWIGRGRRIATAGCTGYCTGTHLHFEVRRRGVALNPMRFLVG